MLRHILSGTIVALFFVTLPLGAAEAGAEKPEWREQVTHYAHGGRCKGVAFSPDGRWLATVGGGGGGDVKLWDVKSGAETAAWEAHLEETKAVAFSPDGQTLVTGGGIWNGPGGAALWNVADRKSLEAFSVPEAGVVGLAFSPDGRTLAVGSGYVTGGRHAGGVILRDLKNRQASGVTLQGHSGSVVGLAFSPDGTTLVTSTLFNEPQSDRIVWELKTWDAATGKEIAVLETSREQAANADFFHVRRVAFSKDGSKLAGGGRTGEGGIVKIWDLASGGSITLPEHPQTVWAVAFAPDGKTLATADSAAGTIRFWSVADARETGSLKAFPGAVFALEFSPDGKHLVAAGTTATREGETRTGIVKLWVRE
jgi:WD40 repeat protein